MSNTATETETEVTHGDQDINWDLDWTILEDLDFQVEFADKCQSIRDEYECPNRATLVCEVKCCKARILLCEDCFFAFYTMAKNGHGKRTSCRFCHQTVVLTTAHMTVVRRIK